MYLKIKGEERAFSDQVLLFKEAWTILRQKSSLTMLKFYTGELPIYVRV